MLETLRKTRLKPSGFSPYGQNLPTLILGYATSAQVKEFIYSTSAPNAINLRGTSATPIGLMYATC